MNQMYPNQNPQPEQPVEQSRIQGDPDKVKKIKTLVFGLAILVVVLILVLGWAYVRLNNCQNAYEDGFNDCSDKVRAMLDADPRVPDYNLPNLTIDQANIGIIT